MPLPVALVTAHRHERISSVLMPNINTEYTLPTQGGLLPMDRWIHSLILMVELRLTNPATGEPTAILADAPFSIIDRVKVEGFHRGRTQQETIIDLSGADIQVMNQIYSSGALHVEPAPSALSLVAAATNDIRFLLEIPFVPLKIPLGPKIGWLLDAPNYQSLQLTIKWADEANVFSGQSNPILFSAFGSATGSPVVHIGARFALGGAGRFRGYQPGRVYRYFRDNSSSDMTTTANDVRLFDIPRGHRIRAITVKTGTTATGATSGNSAFATLSNTILDDLRIHRGLNKINRSFRNMFDLRNECQAFHAIALPDGYGLFEYVPDGWDGEILDARNLVSGPTGDVDLNLTANVVGASDQRARVVYEEWRYAPISQSVRGRQ